MLKLFRDPLSNSKFKGQLINMDPRSTLILWLKRITLRGIWDWGGGMQKSMCMHAHYKRGTRSSFRQASKD